jgi:hypothetical protein
MAVQQAERPNVRTLVILNIIVGLLVLGSSLVTLQSPDEFGGTPMWLVYLNLGFGIGFLISALLIGLRLLIGLLIGLAVNGIFLAWTLFLLFSALTSGTPVNLFYLLRLLSVLALFYIVKNLLNKTERAFFK